jgi:hypothetical protein
LTTAGRAFLLAQHNQRETNAGWNNVAGVEESYGQGFADDGNPTTRGAQEELHVQSTITTRRINEQIELLCESMRSLCIVGNNNGDPACTDL